MTAVAKRQNSKARKGCGQKMEYEDRTLAEDHLDSLLRAGGAPSLRVYKCRYCGKFHVGHKRGGYRRP